MLKDSMYLTHENFFLRLKSMVAVRYLRHTGPIETYYILNCNSPQCQPCTFRAMRRVEDVENQSNMIRLPRKPTC